MKVETGYLYHIKDEFFEKFKNVGLMENHEHGHSRPSYLAIRKKDILWFIPLSTKVEKYKPIIEKKIKKHGQCRSILIRKIAKRESVILIQNAFPTKEKYVKSKHLINGKAINIIYSLQREIVDSLEYTLSLKRRGLNLFFTDIDKINEMLEKEEVKV